MIVRDPEVENREYPFATLNSFITPTAEFYLRNHYPYPTIDAQTWRMTVEGRVEQPVVLGYAELRQLPAETITVTMECAGNNRSLLTPKTEGMQWAQGAVGNATWTGVPLQAILTRAGVQPDAIEVIVEGTDKGEIKEPPKPDGEIHYTRSLPLDDPILTNALLAYAMNGEALSLAHGYPLRLIVPGWYGMASVKWVTRLIVTAKPFHGYYQSIDYALWERVDGIPTRVPITTMQTKASIARPECQEEIPLHTPFCINGAAWSGTDEIAKVEISVDAGQSWHPAQLLGEPVRYAWRLWTYNAPPFTRPGFYTIMARATDTSGCTQAMQRQPDRENYVISHVIPVPITVQ
jgi:DMSO/TMAO reductase YedYZ molybdopterin-dependent catalytic subunit